MTKSRDFAAFPESLRAVGVGEGLKGYDQRGIQETVVFGPGCGHEGSNRIINGKSMFDPEAIFKCDDCGAFLEQTGREIPEP